MTKLYQSVMLAVVANLIAFMQLQGHYVFPKIKFLKTVPYILGLSIPCALMFFHATKLSYEHFGEFWNFRLIGFGIGTITFGTMSWLLLNEIPTIKTIICLLLATAIILIQITNVVKM